MTDAGAHERKPTGKKQIPIEPGLFTVPSLASEEPHLIGGKCPSCGVISFPKQDICVNCSNGVVKETALSAVGKVYSSTISTLPPPSYEGPLPYALGYVELPEGVLVPAIFTECSLERPVEIGTPVKMVVEKWKEDEESNEVMVYKFKPV